jgi:hypothetical protein
LNEAPERLRPRFDVELPQRMKHLPRDKRGFPVPYFVQWQDGQPLFPIFDPTKWIRCVTKARCWVCGDELGRWMTFAIGPMCVVNRISSEPPCHAECANFSMRACPFIINPAMRRVPTERYGDVQPPGGIMETRNPGVMVLWPTRKYMIVRTDSGPVLKVGDPVGVTWWTRGREATAEEARAGFEDGVVALRKRALELDGPEALPELERLAEVARRAYVP